ncbi:putative transcription antitermination protein N [Candidatus Regiella insecticola 5.15]|uniref:Putative transcription antitermination protein N n=1 Tax=Candidatus Regiella insecticola 5.15 TaxID=1005043 RepID=G2H243_9ENTR|nr:hypothetical protein [Candidatus Regiella insecticola]EGY27938.1 putative transcription antitermination protein N [Candidatus Regiella insecticola 5.15]
MVTIIWKPSKGSAKSRYKARRAILVAQRRKDRALARKIELALMGGEHIFNALPSLRDYQQRDNLNNRLLPGVWLYHNTNNRKSNVTTR